MSKKTSIILKRHGQANFWVVKAREKKDDHSEGWHWKFHFPGPECNSDSTSEPDKDWGGYDWIGSPQSKRLIREVIKGDLVVCYQTDHRKILGFTRMDSDGREEDPGSDEYNLFDLAPPQAALVLIPPLSIPELRETGCSPQCFTNNGGRGTVFRLAPDDLDGIINAIVTNSPQQSEKLREWFVEQGLAQ